MSAMIRVTYQYGFNRHLDRGKKVRVANSLQEVAEVMRCQR